MVIHRTHTLIRDFFLIFVFSDKETRFTQLHIILACMLLLDISYVPECACQCAGMSTCTNLSIQANWRAYVVWWNSAGIWGLDHEFKP